MLREEPNYDVNRGGHDKCSDTHRRGIVPFVLLLFKPQYCVRIRRKCFRTREIAVAVAWEPCSNIHIIVLKLKQRGKKPFKKAKVTHLAVIVTNVTRQSRLWRLSQKKKLYLKPSNLSSPNFIKNRYV